MGRGFTLKLAWNNIKQNRKFYLPYVLASVGIIMMFYIMCYLATNKGLTSMAGAEYISFIMALGCVIIGIFSFIFIFYINSFLMKRRNKEIGLYNILGMEKKHIGKILFTENLITSVFSIVAGLLTGILFSKLVHMILCRIMGISIPIVFNVSWLGVALSAVFFGVLFLLVLLRNQMKIRLAKPIELLHGSSVGEQEPKTKIVMSVIGVICLAAGYIIAITIDNPLKAIALFFVAVVLVIIGTYLLFTTVSIVVLKALRRNKNYYYKPGHFTAVSGMLYRMKQNAVGMANICILSTMVLVMVSTTVCMSAGINDVIDQMTPKDVTVSQVYEAGQYAIDKMEPAYLDSTLSDLKDIAAKSDVKVKDATNFTAAAIALKLKDTTFEFGDQYSIMNIITADEYERLTGEKAGISGNEVISSGTKTPGTFTYGGEKYKTVKYVKNLMASGNSNGLDTYNIVVSSLSKVKSMVKTAGDAYNGMTYVATFNSGSSKNATSAMAQKYANSSSVGGGMIQLRSDTKNQLSGFTGGFLFLGIFLGLVFTFAAALIIYYKQISEGYYDKEKFEIMQKVGMGKAEVRKSIRSQVVAVFFVPLIVAGCHMAGAFNMVRQMLSLFSLNNVGLFVGCSVITFLVFAAIYAFVYLVTAKEYYKIVQWGEQ